MTIAGAGLHARAADGCCGGTSSDLQTPHADSPFGHATPGVGSVICCTIDLGGALFYLVQVVCVCVCVCVCLSVAGRNMCVLCCENTLQHTVPQGCYPLEGHLV
uniref:Uncharacterized protein n=1 Tax=Eutreptiella gymnastica TaxID=73025 RepID=A0A7S4FT78_9EUGL